MLIITGRWLDSTANNMFGCSSKLIVCIIVLTGIALSNSTDSLDFSESDLTEVPTSPLNQSIHSLNLDGNNINELFPHSLRNYDKLIKISLQRNWLERIHDASFNNIHNLKQILLNANNIIQLPAHFGPSTSKLDTILLINALVDLSLLVYPYFSSFTSLRYINFGYNQNGNLNDSFFPPNIKWLAVIGGTMDRFPPLSYLTSGITILNFANQQLTAIPQQAIAGLHELRVLHLKSNKIRNFPNLSHCKKLTLMQFEHNELSYIPRKHIEGLEKIREIHFTKNLLENMVDISHLKSLQRFFIGYNFITEIPGSSIEGLINMKTFACNHNKLKTFPNISALFPELEKLYVNGNHLKTLPDLYEFPSLVTLQSGANPYECNVSLCWLRMLPWLKPSVNILQDNPICDLPAAYTDTAVVRFHPTLMGCYNGELKRKLFVY